MCQLPIQTIGIPKTIDNDLCGTDHSPGFGSSAKYIALSTLEAAIDTRAMSQSSTKAFVLEVMGRNSGWLAASSALAKSEHSHAPHIILLPERNVAPTDILNKVKATIDDEGYCVIVVAEGFHLNKLASTKSEACDFGHKRLGGVGQALSELIQNNLGIKTRYANADYLQRAVGHCASATDLDIAYQTGVGAVLALKNGMNNKLIGIRHTSHSPFQWEHYFTSINEVANHEKHLPNEFISPCNMHVTDAFIQYARPLISGEVQVPYHNNIPNYLHNSELSLIKLPKGSHMKFSIRQLLFSKKLMPMLVSGSLSVINDNIMRQGVILLITYKIFSQSDANAYLWVSVMGALYFLPTFLFSVIAGELADKMSKARLFQLTKLAQIPICIFMSLILLQDSPNLYLLGLGLFFMATHDAIFSPVRYGILPETLHKDQLIAGNGLLEASTLISIATGIGLAELSPQPMDSYTHQRL